MQTENISNAYRDYFESPDDDEQETKRSAMIEGWANYLATVHWDNLDELAAIIVDELTNDGEPAQHYSSEFGPQW
jgi:hypothetical protein